MEARSIEGIASGLLRVAVNGDSSEGIVVYRFTTPPSRLYKRSQSRSIVAYGPVIVRRAWAEYSRISGRVGR